MIKTYRDKRYKLNLFLNENYGELYDLKNDPLEKENLFLMKILKN